MMKGGIQMFKNEFLSKDVVVCDLIWTHPDVQKIHSETIRDEEFDEVYIGYDIYKYPGDHTTEFTETKPIFILTKRGCVDPKFYIFKTRGGVFTRLDKEKAKWEKDIENYRTLLVIGKVARS